MIWHISLLVAAMVLRLTGAQLLGGLSCQPTDRHGRRLGKWKPLPPRDCRQPPLSSGLQGGFCDTPGEDYPWDAIDRYLQQSKEVLRKRVEALAAAEVSRRNSLHRRQTRSTDVTDSDVIDAIARDNVGVGTLFGADQSRDSMSGENLQEDALESSGESDDFSLEAESDKATLPPRADQEKVRLREDPPEGSGKRDISDNNDSESIEKRNGEEMAILVSFFTHHSGETVTKEAIKDMLAFKKTFEKPTLPPLPTSTPQEESALPMENPDDLIVAETIRHEVAPLAVREPSLVVDDPAWDQQRQEFLPEVKYYQASTNAPPEIAKSDNVVTNAGRESDAFLRPGAEDWKFIPPRAEPLVARPPSIVEFNRKTSTFPLRNRAPSRRKKIPTRSTTTTPKSTTRAAPQRTSSLPPLKDTPSRKRTQSQQTSPTERSKTRPTQKLPVRVSTAAEKPTEAQSSPATQPTTWDEDLSLFTETVYAQHNETAGVMYTTAIYGPNTKANVTRASTPFTAALVATTTLPSEPEPPATTLDPYTEAACQYRVEVLSPFYAMNTRQEWKTLINIPTYETFIHMEHCAEEKSQGRCAAGCRCTQKFSIRTMPVYDTNDDGCDVIYMDKFAFPSHCDCTCRPAHLMFGVSPSPTTPAPVTSSENTPKQSFSKRPPKPTLSEKTTPPRGKTDPEIKKASSETPPTQRRRPTPLKGRPGVPLPTRRRPVSKLHTTLVPQRAAEPVPPRMPIVPSTMPVLNHRNRFRGPVRSVEKRDSETSV